VVIAGLRNLGARRIVYPLVATHPCATTLNIEQSFGLHSDSQPSCQSAALQRSPNLHHCQLISAFVPDKPTALASPWQNGFSERLIGSIRRECVDRFVVLGGAGTRGRLTGLSTPRSTDASRLFAIRAGCRRLKCRQRRSVELRPLPAGRIARDSQLRAGKYRADEFRGLGRCRGRPRALSLLHRTIARQYPHSRCDHRSAAEDGNPMTL
jgi:hypothetical protein